MKRYFIASLAAGIVYALLGPVFVHFALDQSLRDELATVLANVMGKVQPATDAAAGTVSGTDWGQFALHVCLRVLFGFVTMAAFVVLARKRPRFRAARLAGVLFWVLGYVVWPVVLAVKFGMGTTLLFVAIGYGLVETQVAAHVGALAWGRDVKAK